MSLVQTVGKFSKRDFLQMYGNPEMYVFEGWIEPIINQIGWVSGKKQVFPPRVAKLIIDTLGEPISLKHLNQ